MYREQPWHAQKKMYRETIHMMRIREVVRGVRKCPVADVGIVD
jgi:hypothetical protein